MSPDRCAGRVRDVLECQLARFPERIALCRTGTALDANDGVPSPFSASLPRRPECDLFCDSDGAERADERGAPTSSSEDRT